MEKKLRNKNKHWIIYSAPWVIFIKFNMFTNMYHDHSNTNRMFDIEFEILLKMSPFGVILFSSKNCPKHNVSDCAFCKC